MKYKIALFGVKSDTHFIYNNLRHEIDLGITLDDREKSNYHISGVASLKNSYINCFESDCYKLDSKSCDTFFQTNEFDLGIVVGWQRLIPAKVLNQFKYGVYGFHASPLGLPFGKGRSPLNWSIIKGYKQVYNHCFKYNPQIDDGDIFSTTKLEIYPWDNVGSMKKKILIDCENALSKLICSYKNGEITLCKQDINQKETFFPKRSPKDGKINLNKMSTKDIYNLIRGVSKPFPGAFLNYSSTKCIIWEAQPFSTSLYSNEMVGKVVKVFEDGSFVLKTLDSTLLITDYQGIWITEGMLLS